jgi:hypothetical protein
MKDLNIRHLTNDYTEELNDFLEETVAVVVTSSDPLYFGKEKPLNNLYIKYETPSVSKISYDIEYFDGNNWVSVLNLNDDTKKQTRSGFITWQEADDNTVIEETTVDSVSNFWYRMVPTADSTVTITAMGVLFSQDRDIFQARPALDDVDFRSAVVGSDTDYTRVHLEIKEQIIQDIRNDGILKYQSENEPERLKFYRNITEWDLFDIDEIKQAAKNLALSKIYFSLSDATDDKWEQEARRFNSNYVKNMDLAHISLDRDNDGKLQQYENIKAVKSTRMSR